MNKYNWQLPDWPNFRYDLSQFLETLVTIAEKTGLANGKIYHLNENLQSEALVNFIVEEAIKTSEIEGEYLSRTDVRSSIINKLGLHQAKIRVNDQRAQGIAELLLNIRDTFQQPLTEETLFNWHLMLMSGSYNPNLRVGYWRTDEEPMQIVSGTHDRWIVHFEAPPSSIVPDQMQKFLQWFNDTAPNRKNSINFPPIRAAIAHLYFESIHPFADGNGRIGRAIAQKALFQGFGYPALLSLSQVIEANKKNYYNALHEASRSNEITKWLQYFINVVLQAQIDVEKQINFILKKSTYFKKFEAKLNSRQLKVIQRMLKEGIDGFEGGMSAKKYTKIANTSKASATRDLQDLVTKGALIQIGEGRSVRYELNIIIHTV